MGELRGLVLDTRLENIPGGVNQSQPIFMVGIGPAFACGSLVPACRRQRGGQFGWSGASLCRPHPGTRGREVFSINRVGQAVRHPGVLKTVEEKIIIQVIFVT
jgi:hypothetical protein